MRRELADGYELDDDPARIEREAVHRFLSTEAYWAIGRSREVVDETLDGAARLAGLYLDGHQVGFARVVSDRHTIAYLADVYVLEAHRGRGLGAGAIHRDGGSAGRHSENGACTRAMRTRSTGASASVSRMGATWSAGTCQRNS